MRIVQINLQPDYGGAENYTLMLSDGLRGLGHEVTVLCHPGGKLSAQAQIRGLPVRALTASSQLDFGTAIHISRQLRALRPDIVHLQTPREYISGVLGAKLARVPITVATRHMLLPVKPSMRLIYKSLHSVVVLSQAVRANLIRCGVPEERTRVIYAGIDADQFIRATQDGSGPKVRKRLGLSSDRLLVGMAARMVEGKGHDCLIDAAAHLFRHSDDVTFVLAGEGPLRARLEAKVQERGIADRFLFAGFYSDMPEFMAALDICVMASTCDDVMPLVLMEAMAAGCPVVASDVGSVRELIQHETTGMLVPAGAPVAIADAIRHLMNDPMLRAKIALAGQAEVQRCFSLGRMVDEIDELYTQLLAQSSSRDVASSK
jgi:glycosyltransferase involved in cell wall biosynthesis